MSVWVEVAKFHGIALLLSSLGALIILLFLIDWFRLADRVNGTYENSKYKDYTFKGFLKHFSCIVVLLYLIGVFVYSQLGVKGNHKQVAYTSDEYYLDLSSIDGPRDGKKRVFLYNLLMGEDDYKLRIKNKKTGKKSSVGYKVIKELKVEFKDGAGNSLYESNIDGFLVSGNNLLISMDGVTGVKSYPLSMVSVDWEAKTNTLSRSAGSYITPSYVVYGKDDYETDIKVLVTVLVTEEIELPENKEFYYK